MARHLGIFVKKIPSIKVTDIAKAISEDAVVNVGPLTIFAPLNSAFDKLPEGTYYYVIQFL